MRCSTCGCSLVGARFDHEDICSHAFAMRSNGQIANVSASKLLFIQPQRVVTTRYNVGDFKNLAA